MIAFPPLVHRAPLAAIALMALAGCDPAAPALPDPAETATADSAAADARAEAEAKRKEELARFYAGDDAESERPADEDGANRASGRDYTPPVRPRPAEENYAPPPPIPPVQ